MLAGISEVPVPGGGFLAWAWKLAKKINKAKFVRNPKTNEKIYKNETYKIHFKIGKILHNRINEKKWI